MDPGNREEEDRLGTAAPHHHHLNHSLTFRPDLPYEYTYLEPDDHTYAHPGSPVLVGHSPYGSHNLEAVSTNDHLASPADAHGGIFVGNVNPDDFYRSYRGVQTSIDSPTTNGYMATSASSRPRESPSALRPPNGSTSKQPLPPAAAARNGLRPTTRFISSPIDDRSTKPQLTGHGSVKDKIKKFDQTATTTSSIPRAPLRSAIPARSTRDGTTSAAGAQAKSPTVGQPSYSALRTSASRDLAAERSSSRTQRTKFAVEDQTSSNAQSFASRIGKPRTAVTGNPLASKSMTHLPPSPSVASPPTSSSSAASPRPQQGLLFGEILPEQRGTLAVGYGIEGVRPRRTSESNLHVPRTLHQHQRTLSDADVEPPSPSDWYRGPASPQANNMHSSSTAKNHLRAHSDTAGTKANIQPSRRLQPARPAAETLSHNTPTSPTTSSRLPLSVRKLASPTNSSSPPSTRSNSPSNPKRPGASSHGKSASRSGTMAARAKTPTSRSKTPTQSQTATPNRKPPPIDVATPNSNNTRLNAYISAPPPKLSPPLRSSRPRQPVSSATTASSRMKSVDRPKSPSKHTKSSHRSEESSRPRKISVGPIDFEQRREHIKLAYSKSIRESQAKLARQQAAERRKKELEAAAKAKAAVVGTTMTTKPRINLESVEDVQEPEPVPVPVSVPMPVPVPPLPVTQRLSISTNLQTDQKPLRTPELDADSPTLGIPGSFPSTLSPPLAQGEIPVPQSAVSATTVATEFDIEPQTQPPVQQEFPVPDVDTDIEDSSQHETPLVPTVHAKAEYQYPFEDEPPPAIISEEPVSIQISLDVTEPEPSVPVQPSQVRTQYESPVIPGAFQDDEFEPAPYPPKTLESTVTILRRESDLSSYRDSRHEGTTPFPAIDDYEEPEYRMKFDQSEAATLRQYSSRHVEPPMDDCSEDAHDQDKTAESPVPLMLNDSLSSHRASTCESSDAGYFDESHHAGYEIHHAGDPSNTLAVPSMLTPANRSSQLSAWTDFSIDSSDPSELATRATSIQHHALPISEDAVVFTMEPKFTVDGRESASQSIHYSPELSPLDVPGSRPDSFAERHQLPELDTGDGFSVPYLSKRTSRTLSHVKMPEHEPPPIPTSSSASAYEREQTPQSGYWDATSANTYIDSRRESEDVTQPLSTPHSVGKFSVDSASLSMGGVTPVDSDPRLASASNSVTDKQGPMGKEKHRLQQRRNVIKELIDTEAVFVRDMSIVEEIYKGTAEACPKLDAKTVKLIFRNTDEIIAFHTTFLTQLKEAVASVYTPQGRRSPLPKEESGMTDASNASATSQPTVVELDDSKDRETAIGPVFKQNIDKMKVVHEAFLRNSGVAAKRLIEIQKDATVKVWLNECNEVAKDLTAAWDLDSLLIKPMQRITKYPNLVITLLQHTPADHPDRGALVAVKESLETAIIEINKTKKNFELVGQIVGRKRKESDVKAGFARAFGKRVDKLQASSNRPPEDDVYQKLHEKFGDDYLRLQVVLRDVEFYTRQVSSYVHEFLVYLSSIELVMRLQPGSHPELESKWVQFNMSMRDIEKVALEQHLSQVRKHVIEPFELVIKAYGNPSLAMKKRAKRRLDYERSEQLRKSGKSIDAKLREQVEQYDALNETLKKELPKLSSLTEKVGNICLGNFVNIQANWYAIWKEKVKVALDNPSHVPELREIISAFQHDFKFAQDDIAQIGILNPLYKGRTSQSTTASAATDDTLSKVRTRPPELSPTQSQRDRGISVNSDHVPVLPTPDFTKRHSGQFTQSPTSGTIPSPHHYYYRDYYAGINNQQRPGSGSPNTPDVAAPGRAFPPPTSNNGAAAPRPSTGRSFDSTNAPRQNPEMMLQHNRRDSNSTYGSPSYTGGESRRFSGLFISALPPDSSEEAQRSSRASSRERAPASGGYNILWLAASLFEFNIETTKHEAGYPYLVYQAGEIFDVIAEKGELWLAKNQDDPNEQVGWIWSKHFAKLADS